MNCQKIKELIPEFIDGGLKDEMRNLIESHVSTCLDCRRELRAMEKAWHMLGEVEEIKPDPYYVPRFWAKVDAQKPWYEHIFQPIREIFPRRRWIPAFAAAGVILIAAGITFRQNYRVPQADTIVATLNDVDLDMVKYIEIIEDFEIIQEIDFYSDLEIIENLDEFEAS